MGIGQCGLQEARATLCEQYKYLASPGLISKSCGRNGANSLRVLCWRHLYGVWGSCWKGMFFYSPFLLWVSCWLFFTFCYNQTLGCERQVTRVQHCQNLSFSWHGSCQTWTLNLMTSRSRFYLAGKLRVFFETICLHFTQWANWELIQNLLTTGYVLGKFMKEPTGFFHKRPHGYTLIKIVKEPMDFTYNMPGG